MVVSRCPLLEREIREHGASSGRTGTIDENDPLIGAPDFAPVRYSSREKVVDLRLR